jgi:hypothetical protein
VGAVSAAFRGGPGLTKILRGIEKKVGAPRVDVGFLAGADYTATVHRPNQGGLSVAQVAFWNEFGTAHSPPRPFFRQMIERNKETWPAMLGNALRTSNYDATAALTKMGIEMTAELQDSIRSGDFDPLSPITLMIRQMADDDPSLVITGATVGEAARRVAEGEQGATGDRGRLLQDTLRMVEAVDFRVVVR